MTLSNKQIHELLEKLNNSIKEGYPGLCFSLDVNNNTLNLIGMGELGQILQHLLEEDIKNNRKRPFCKEHGEDYKVIYKKNWFMVSSKGEYFYEEGWFYCPVCFVKETENLESILEDNSWLKEYVKKSQQDKEE